jgi:hypothetical protein
MAPWDCEDSRPRAPRAAPTRERHERGEPPGRVAPLFTISAPADSCSGPETRNRNRRNSQQAQLCSLAQLTSADGDDLARCFALAGAPLDLATEDKEAKRQGAQR